MKRLLAGLLAACCLPAAAGATELTAIDVDARLEAVQLGLVLEGDTEPHVFELADPARVVIDLPGVVLDLGGSRRAGDGQIIDRVRYSQYVLEPEPVTRIVLDLARATSYRVNEVSSGFVLEFERPRTAARSEKVATPPVEPEESVPTPPQHPARTATTTTSTLDAPGSDADARITYMTVSTAYVSAGRKDGLSEGARLSVMREEDLVGELEVESVSTRRASCRIVDGHEDLQVGDRVGWLQQVQGQDPQFQALSQQSSAVGAPVMTTDGNFQDWLRDNGFRGRLSGRYLTVRDRSGTGQSFSQPALDARVEGRDVNGSNFDVSLDVRTRRTFREEPDGGSSQEGRSRIYRANGTWKNFDSKLHLTVGRQYSPELSSLSIFDGASMVWRGPRWTVGALSGSQPDLENFGYSNEIREHGVFAQLLASQGAANKMSFTVGAIGSYSHGEINREYLTLQSHVASGAVSAYVSQDIDLNRDWKRDVEGSALSWNNTYASVRYQTAEQTTLSGGFDNRRSIRLYRDYVTPEVEFDDTYRTGYWMGVNHRIGKRYRLGARVKRSTGGSAGGANTYTANAGLQWHVSLRARTTRFENELVRGWIHSGSASSQVGPRLHLEVGGGLRTQQSTTPTANDDPLTWTNFLADYSLGRSWYASLSFERSRQGSEANDQIFSMLNYRF